MSSRLDTTEKKRLRVGQSKLSKPKQREIRGKIAEKNKQNLHDPWDNIK